MSSGAGIFLKIILDEEHIHKIAITILNFSLRLIFDVDLGILIIIFILVNKFIISSFIFIRAQQCTTMALSNPYLKCLVVCGFLGVVTPKSFPRLMGRAVLAKHI